MTALSNLWVVLALTGAAPDISVLTPTQQGVFKMVAAEEFCSCNSALTLAGCLELRKDCRIAERTADLVFRMAEANLSSDEVLGYLSERVSGPYCTPPKTLPVDGAPSRGPQDARISLVEFADFRCAHCRTAASIVKEALERYGKDVRYVFVAYPLNNHPLSVAAAEAAMAAGAQGKFWEMHDALFENQDRDFEPKVIESVAAGLGLNMQTFRSDLSSHKYRDRILAMKKQGTNAGVEGTPAFFVNGRPYELDTVLYTLRERFAMERDRNKGKCE